MGKIEIIKSRDEFFEYTDLKGISIDDELLALHEDISSNIKYKCALRSFPQNCCQEIFKRKGELFKDLGIKLHDVYCLNEDKLSELDLNNVSLISPLEIPVEWKIPYITITPTASTVFILTKTEEKEKRTLFLDIMVHMFNDCFTSCFYNHELSHTQINSIIGSCNNRLNNEVIPALMEQITAYQLDSSLNTLEKIRDYGLDVISDCIFEVKGRTNDKMSRKSLTYIKSYLESFKLANIYLSGNEDIRKEMHSYINNIFSGNRSVEDMLNHYDAQYENVPKKLELICKY